jgi:hypothetical protein
MAHYTYVYWVSDPISCEPVILSMTEWHSVIITKCVPLTKRMKTLGMNMRPEMLPYWAIRTLWKHYSSWWNIWWCDSLSKIFVYTKTSTSYWFTSHKIHITRQFAGFTCLFFIENVWRAHLCHGCRPQCVLVSTPLYAQNILCALQTASWHTTMQSLHSRRLSTLNTEDEYTRDFTYPHKQKSSGFGHSSLETTPSVHLYLPNTRSQCNILSVEAWYVLRVLDYLCVYIINSIM